MTKSIAIILINYKDYAKDFLAKCRDSLASQDYAGGTKLFIVDNESTSESRTLLEMLAPKAEIIINKNNDGFAKGNNDAMKLALKEGFEYIFLFNMDTELAPDCVSKMVEAAASDKLIGAVQARLMLYRDKDKINSLGNVTHFLGFGYCDGYGNEHKTDYLAKPAGGVKESIKEICYPSGAAVLFKAEVLKKIGLFDEEFWMYNEDQDLGWRMWLNGFKCVLAAEAVVYHKYEFSRSIRKYYYLDRNRIIAMLKNYHWATLVLTAPAFFLMEPGLLFYAAKNGWFYEKVKVYNYFLNIDHWRRILAERKKVQSLRIVKDRKIVRLFSGKIWYQEIGEKRLKFANIIFNAYWKIIRVLIRW